MMKKKDKKYGLCILVILIIVLALTGCGKKEKSLTDIMEKTGNYLNEKNPLPSYGSIGGEWLMMGFELAGYPLDEKKREGYLDSVKQAVKDADGVLDERKYTEYARVILSLEQLGEDAADVEGYDLTEKLFDTDKVAMQGLNGIVWAVIALESVSENGKNSEQIQESTQILVKRILKQELSAGGWSLNGNEADAEITAMCVLALSLYQNKDPKIESAIDKGINILSSLQEEDGCYSTMGEKNSESTAQVLHALCAAGIDIEKDERFIKNGATILDGLFLFSNADGGFSHRLGEESDEMATEQVYYALGRCL